MAFGSMLVSCFRPNRRCQNRSNEIDAGDYAVYTDLFRRKGDKEKAKEQLGKAIDIYEECGADGWVTRAKEELARIS